ncbi:MAG: precorrin-6y C5,15-methyltransferase (decarboxylating) subunit CbiE [Chloroflexi bacterium]|nr:precorrin-6y C5,15-methyltransferase (decarboxylating) subunit CbiE [Chloroflexota bacterium]
MPEEQRIVVLGVGPGHPQYLSVIGSELLWQAHAVAGFAAVLKSAEPWIHGEKLVMDYKNQELVLEAIAARAARGERCVVCAAGDSCVSAGELIARVRRRWRLVDVIPGISSVQVAAARAGITLEESLVISLHQRAEVGADMVELTEELGRGRRNIIVLIRPWDLMPPDIARGLLSAGIAAARPVSVFEELTLETEKLHSFALEELARSPYKFSDRSVMVFPRA